VRTPQQLIDLARGLISRSAPLGRRIAILADGGGHGTVAAEVAPQVGLLVPPFSPDLTQQLREFLPATASTANPIDMAGGGEQNIFSFAQVTNILLDSDEVDAVLMSGYFGGYADYGEELAAGELVVARALAERLDPSQRLDPSPLGPRPKSISGDKKPLFVHTMHHRSPAALLLREGRIPVYRSIEAATSALARVAERAERRPPGVPPLPPAAAPLTGAGYWSARQTIAGCGVPYVTAELVRTQDEALAAATRIGYPVALKALDLEHKSDTGGVVLGIQDARTLIHTLERLRETLAPLLFSVEQMAPLADGVEVLIGVRRDHRFGPIAVAGLGGIFTELLGDIAVALAPVDADQAEVLLRSLRGSALLTGLRGRPPMDIGAAARALADLSWLAATHPEIDEVEVNPLLILPTGVLALDARLLLRQTEPSC
jgi:acyl-CoA synthetase (NDP forming)